MKKRALVWLLAAALAACAVSGCAPGAAGVTATTEVVTTTTADPNPHSTAGTAAATEVGGETPIVLFDIPVMQQGPVDCEATAIAMMLQPVVPGLTRDEVSAAFPTGGRDPNKAYTLIPPNTSHTINPVACVDAINGLMPAAFRAMDMTGCDIDAVKAQLDKGYPVAVWMANFDGLYTHTITVIGYSASRIIYNDPYLNQLNSQLTDRFVGFWKAHKFMALSYEWVGSATGATTGSGNGT
ncbi:MAG: C39 family peptidase [Oscillospiraceae bacterium]|nr:C39 family peptidase [Oscillospiraceae bacterium]